MDSDRSLAGPRYRIIYSTTFVVLLVLGVALFAKSGDWIERVAHVCAAAAGISFAIAEFCEVGIVIGQAIRELRKDRREKREEALIERGRQEGRREEREELRRKGLLIEEPDENGAQEARR